MCPNQPCTAPTAVKWPGQPAALAAPEFLADAGSQVQVVLLHRLQAGQGRAARRRRSAILPSSVLVCLPRPPVQVAHMQSDTAQRSTPHHTSEHATLAHRSRQLAIRHQGGVIRDGHREDAVAALCKLHEHLQTLFGCVCS